MSINKIFLGICINDLPITQRAKNILVKNNITMMQLMKLKYEDLLKIKNLGFNDSKEIITVKQYLCTNC